MNIVVKSVFTREENAALADAALKYGNPQFLKRMKLLSVLFAVLEFFSVLMSVITFNFKAAAGLVVFGVVYFLVIVISLKKVYPDTVQKTNAHVLGAEMTHAFYGNYFYEGCRAQHFNVEESADYSFLKTVTETPTHFILFTNGNRTSVIPKKCMQPQDVYDLSLFFSSYFPNIYSAEKPKNR